MASIQERIASLRIGEVGRAPVTANDPDALKRPPADQRSQSTSIVPTFYNGSSSNGVGNEPNGSRRDGVLPPPMNIVRTGQYLQQQQQQPPKRVAAAPPSLPQRKLSTQVSPALPPRRTSGQLSRKASNDSVSSAISAVSIPNCMNGTAKMPVSRTVSNDTSRVKAPVFDPASLPPLPPKRTQIEVEKRYHDIEKSKAFPGYRDIEKAKILQKAAKSTPSASTIEITPPPVTPALPPRRNAREEPPPTPLPRMLTSPEHAPPKPARSALSYGMNKAHPQNTVSGEAENSPPAPSRNGAAPPIPISSRPDLSRIAGSKPKPQAQASILPPTDCLICRDFSAADSHAAKFPRQSVPSLDWLATQLTAPFPSRTDQARCTFTWLHQNISYDVAAFFGNRVQPSTPASTLATGLAVCEGYAGLFSAIASKVGLESVVVGGHGKGFGFASLQPGDPIPAESQGHAWNAVKIDNGYWKLIDCCWGAGNIGGPGQPYNKDFSPRFFTMPNDDFGLRHYPQNRSQFFRDDGHNPSWEEYIVGDTGGEAVRVFSGVAQKEGVGETSILPRYLKLPVSASAHGGPIIRFQFSLVCDHWDPVRNGGGKPYVFILAIYGADGTDDFVPFETNGKFWWLDIEPRKLGRAGQTVSCFTVDNLNGVSARGLSVDEYRMAKGRKAMGFSGLCAWELV